MENDARVTSRLSAVTVSIGFLVSLEDWANTGSQIGARSLRIDWNIADTDQLIDPIQNNPTSCCDDVKLQQAGTVSA